MMSRQSSEPIVITNVQPELDCGRYAVKREIGDWLQVWADIFRDGHDVIASALLFRSPSSKRWSEMPMEEIGNDRWYAGFPLDEVGRWNFTIESWTDRWATWLRDTAKKRDAGLDLALELSEGKHAVAQTRSRIAVGDFDRGVLDAALEGLESCKKTARGIELLFDPTLDAAMRRHPDRSRAARYKTDLSAIVDRERARFAAWYELFPRSQGTQPGVHGTFKDVERRLPDIAEMGFDVLYLAPVHPIGRAHRKGRNNDPQGSEEDVGSPWAIGGREGGHTSLHPALGTLAQFRHLVKSTQEHGMEIAMDYAVQASPDHPWIKEHPEWFSFRPDGSIKHAENPPKKYQDIVNFDFERGGMPLWEALRDVVFFWIDQGVKTFRVDNPHTKPIPFWEWMIAEVQQRHPDVIFLAEAFTRPKVMWELAKAGFTQSYTYFTWRNAKQELTDYAIELAALTNAFLRPNLFTNTPDILHRYLQTGGRPAFIVRLVLAATMGSAYGIYSGFELLEDRAYGDSEEYLDSEKYEIRVRDWTAAGNIRDEIRRVNAIRNDNQALREFENIRFYPSNDDNVIFYGKVDYFRRNHVFAAVNLDPNAARAPALEFPTGEFGLDPDAFSDALFDTQLRWSNGRAYTVLDPQRNPAAIFIQNR